MAVELPVSDTHMIVLAPAYTLEGLTIDSYRPVSADHDVVIVRHATQNELMIFNGEVEDMVTHTKLSVTPIV